MILMQLTQGNGAVVWVNPEHVESVRRAPDAGVMRAVLGMASGERLEIVFNDDAQDFGHLVQRLTGHAGDEIGDGATE